MRTFSIAPKKRDYVLTYTFVSKNKDDKSDEFFLKHFEDKIYECKEFSNHFGPVDFDQTTIAFDSSLPKLGDVELKLCGIICDILLEYRKENPGYKYHKDCKLFIMYPEIDRNHPQIAHIIIKDLSKEYLYNRVLCNIFEVANNQ